MTDYEIATEYMHRALVCIAETQEYTNWSDSFSLRNIREQVKNLKSVNGYKEINPTLLTVDQLKTLGFRYFDEDLLCIPLWIRKHLIDGFQCKSICGKSLSYSKDYQDNDHRYGVMSIGIVIKKGKN